MSEHRDDGLQDDLLPDPEEVERLLRDLPPERQQELREILAPEQDDG